MRIAPTLAALGLLLAAQAAQALGFGSIVNATQLGQRLNFAATIKLADDESIARQCVAADVYSGSNKLQPGQVLVSLESGSKPDERSVRVTTYTVIDEPVVTINVTVGCGSKVSRSFVAFVDPPLAGMNQAAVDPSQLPAQHVDSQVAPLVDIVRGASAPVRVAAQAPSARSEHVAASGNAKAGARPPAASQHPIRVAHAAPIRKRAVLPAAPKPGPRLELDPPTVLAARAADDAASSAAALVVAQVQAAQASSVQAQAQDRERLQQLEKQLAAMRVEAQTMQQTMLSLQARLRDSDAQRYSNPVVLALAILSALLAVMLAMMWWRQARRPETKWWAAPDSEQSRAAVAAPPPVRLEPPEAAVERTDAHVAPARPQPAPALVTALPVAEQRTLPAGPRDISVDELIDLEQQAEFFVVLGQDEAAIDLLMSHVRSSGGIGPLPYLKLLEIYRRRGEDDAYERIRERFNRRFNAQAPQWEADPNGGRTLEDHPTMQARVQALWSTPARVMEMLESALFRYDASEETFDLPAYGQLLFLYSIARDLRGQESGANPAVDDVDLLLPLDGAAPAAVPIGPRPAAVSAVDIDVGAPLRGAARPPAVTVRELDSKSAFIEFADTPVRSAG